MSYPWISYNSLPADTLFQVFLNNVIDDGTAARNSNPMQLPLSFKVAKNHPFTEDPKNNEKILVTWGLNIYDGACWEIALWLLKDTNANLLDQVRLNRKTTQFGSIISNNVNSKRANQYLAPIIIDENAISSGPINPTQRSSVNPYDPNGFTFRTISNYYNYNSITIQPEQWSSIAKYWNDYNPTSGENAWFYGLGPFIRNVSNFKGYSGFISTLFNMMDINGGFYYSPINNTNKTWSFSSENNCSMYGTLSQIRSYLQTILLQSRRKLFIEILHLLVLQLDN